MTFDLSSLLIAFLGGGGVTAIAFMASYADRLTKVETQLKGMATTLKEIKDSGHISPCPTSQLLKTDVEVLKNKVDGLSTEMKCKISIPFHKTLEKEAS